ncbi:MAG: RecX family transcriptional regulator [Patescibacteria group bacterium]
MPRITRIKPQKNKNRVNIYLDGKFGFGLDLENFVKLGLKVEQELSEKEVAEIVKKAEFQKISDKLLRFATLRPRSEKEIKIWLKKKKVYPSLYENLFKRLKRLELLDDKKFAAWWVEQRVTFKPRGKRALALELRNKGIDKEVTDEVLAAMDFDEEAAAEELLLRKREKWKSLEGREARQKMAAFLARKGFGWGVIEKTLNKL